VGKVYQRWVSYGGYRPVSAIPASIRLPDGVVSCVSCHESYSERHGALVMANDRSQICYGCHDL
jgi:predicted CXXCH cytochrome family protein